MNETQKLPNWFWAIVAVALLWNTMGLVVFFMSILMPPELLAAMPEEQRTLMQSIPLWATIAFAIAVFCGVFACIALAMRKAWAVLLFKLSLAGVIIQNFSAFFVQDSYSVLGPGGTVMPILVITTSIVLLWFSLRARNNGWIK